MIPKSKFDTLESLEAINVEVQERYALIREMVGTLYPAVLLGEIELLLDKRAAYAIRKIQAAAQAAGG